jgi:hypothetical protein
LVAQEALEARLEAMVDTIAVQGRLAEAREIEEIVGLGLQLATYIPYIQAGQLQGLKVVERWGRRPFLGDAGRPDGPILIARPLETGNERQAFVARQTGHLFLLRELGVDRMGRVWCNAAARPRFKYRWSPGAVGTARWDPELDRDEFSTELVAATLRWAEQKLRQEVEALAMATRQRAGL